MNFNSFIKKQEEKEPTNFKEACSKANLNLMKKFFDEKKININEKDSYGRTFLISCCWSSKKEEISDCVKFLLDFEDIDVNAICDRATALIFALWQCGLDCHSSVHKERFETVKMLVQDPRVDVNLGVLGGELSHIPKETL